MTGSFESDRYRQFESDIGSLLRKLCEDVDVGVERCLHALGGRLIELYHGRLVKINHSVMELICAKPLLLREYDVEVEYLLDSNLICDIYAVKGDGVFIVEVETGYTPPNHALDPFTYNKARISSKIARYSSYANKFALATPNYNVLHIPRLFSMPARVRSEGEVEENKKLCDLYYSHPSVTVKQIREANLQSVYIIDVDICKTREIDPETYQDLITKIENLGLRSPSQN